MNFSKFRKLDYLIFYLIIVVLFVMQLTSLSFSHVMGILIGGLIPSLILGTITNLIFKKR
ncbi:MAG: hypothetical protein ACRCYC_14920 [Paraclostridium sp.]|uniref:hypothetical protein n=1 Tax=Paraclostridium sp. TaxID=2023273 RepID=UPI003A9ADED9